MDLPHRKDQASSAFSPAAPAPLVVTPEHNFVTLSYLLPPDHRPPSGLIDDEFVLFSRTICNHALEDSDINVRTSTYVVPTFEVGKKKRKCTERNYQYLLALALGVDIVDEEGIEIDGDDEYWRRVDRGRGQDGLKESADVVAFWKEVKKRTISNPVTFSKVKVRSVRVEEGNARDLCVSLVLS